MFLLAQWNTWPPLWRASIALFLLSVAAKLLVLVFLMSLPGGSQNLLFGDSTHYRALGDSVIAGQGFVYKGEVETYRPPGYPVYFAFFDALHVPLAIASFFQILVASLLPVLVVWCGVRFLGLPRRWAMAAGILAALEPMQTYYAVMLMPDVFFAAGVLGALVLLALWWESPRARYVIFAGVLLGIANYMRPAMSYFPLLFLLGAGGYLAATHALTKKRMLHLFLFLIVPLLVLSPWYARNYIEFHALEFVSVKAFTLYEYGAASSLAIAHDVSYETERVPLIVTARAEAPNQNLESFADEAYLLAKAKEIILAHPKEFIESYLLGLNTFWFSGNYHYTLLKYGIIGPPPSQVSFSLLLASKGPAAFFDVVGNRIGNAYLDISILGKLYWVLIGLIAAYGLFHYRRNPFALMTALLAAYSCATVLATTIGIEARHRYYLNPLLFLFFVATLYLLYVRTHRRDTHT